MTLFIFARNVDDVDTENTDARLSTHDFESSFYSNLNLAPQPYFENGKLKWSSISKKATSYIVYRTIGWTFHPDYEPLGNPTQVGKAFAKVMLEQVDEQPYSDTEVITFFEVSEELVNDALIKMGKENIKNGDVFYLSAIFEVRKYY